MNAAMNAARRMVCDDWGAMKGFGWWVRVRNAFLAGLVGWLAGVLASIPFEVGVASRYIAGQSDSLIGALAGGMLVWSGFALFMASIAWVLLVLPVALFVPPRWIVRWRYILVPGSVPAAAIAYGVRMHIFERENFSSVNAFLNVFWTAPNVFAMVFAPVLTATYLLLAKRRAKQLRPSSP